MKCRHCFKNLKYTFLELGHAPPSNSYLDKNDIDSLEEYFPLNTKVCNHCWLVQTTSNIKPEKLFTDNYGFESNLSETFNIHLKKYFDKIHKFINLNKKSLAIEIGSNDGSLLKYFVKKKIACLGIEPAANLVKKSKNLKIPTLNNFFSNSLALKLKSNEKMADLIIANNVYAHTPDINDFTKGLKTILKPSGVITLEFHHLLSLIQNLQFDTIYHEHYSYLSLHAVNNIFTSVGLRIWHVEKLKIHGQSLRIYGCHQNDNRKSNVSVNKILKEEVSGGLKKIETYLNFKNRLNKNKYDLLEFLIKQKKLNKQVVAYCASAKGNTLLNYLGVKQDLIKCVFDGSKFKQNKFMPGSHIPILSPNKLKNMKIDYILIFSWNIFKEIKKKKNLLKKNIKFLIVNPKIKFV